MPLAAVHLKVFDPFASNDPFDLSSGSGSSAFYKILSLLDTSWNGDVSSFLSFVALLRIRAQVGKWDAIGDEDILTINVKNILIKYYTVKDTNIEAAQMAHTNDREFQSNI